MSDSERWRCARCGRGSGPQGHAYGDPSRELRWACEDREKAIAQLDGLIADFERIVGEKPFAVMVPVDFVLERRIHRGVKIVRDRYCWQVSAVTERGHELCVEAGGVIQ